MNTQQNSKQKSGNTTLKVIFLGLAVVLLMFFISMKIKGHKSKPQELPTTSSETGTAREVLYLVSTDSVGPGIEWTTPKIDYKFKIRTDGHAVNLQFSGDNGSWLESVPYPREGDFNMPSNAQAGPVKVTAGKEETHMFRVQLYKILNITLR